jgi:hypothetical protein
VLGVMYQVYMTLFNRRYTMAVITRFEDIQAWQEARKLVKMIYKLTTQELLQKTLAFAIKSSAPLSLR